MKAIGKKSISIFLALILVMGMMPFHQWGATAHAAPAASAAYDPLRDKNYPSTEFTDKGKFKVAIVKRELDANADATPFTYADFKGGAITKHSAPNLSNYEFVRAFVVDPETKAKMPIRKANLMDVKSHEGTGSGYNEKHEDRVFFSYEENQDPNIENSYKYSANTPNIYFEYFEKGKMYRVTYETLNNEIILNGPPFVNVKGGIAKVYFTVSIPRGNKVSVLANGSSQNVRVYNDVSTARRSAYVYEATITSDTKITANLHKPSAFTVADAGTANQKSDWTGAGQGVGLTDRFKHSSEKDVMVGEITGNGNIKPGETVHLKMYQNKLAWSRNSGGSTYTSWLAALHINGYTFGAPQPMARFGPSQFTDTTRVPRETPQYRPYYSGDDSGNNNVGSGKGYVYKGDKTVVSFFSEQEGWDAYWDAYKMNGYSGDFWEWYYTQIIGKVIDAKSVYYPQSGPLAGSRVTIRLMDAKPSAWTGPLLKWGYKADGSIDETAVTQARVSDNHNRTSKNWGGLYEDRWNAGKFNSLRLAYDVEITNVQSDLTIDSEWVSGTAKLGAYLNYGVENMQVKATKVNAAERDYSKKEKDLTWTDLPDGSWIDVPALGNTYIQTKMNNSPAADDPYISLRGDVKNGYTRPVYVDEAMSENNHGTVDPRRMDAVHYTGMSGDRGFYVWSPGFAYGTSKTTGDSYHKYAGMNIFGVRTTLVEVPVDYHLNGGQSVHHALFPNKYESQNNPRYLYNVESNPVIRTPREVPTKAGAQFLYWKVFSVVNENPTPLGINLLAGQSIDIRELKDAAGRALRITDTSGNINVDTIRMVAIYSDDKSAQNQGSNFRVELKAGSDVLDTKNFKSVSGASASIKKSSIEKVAPLNKTVKTTLSDGSEITKGYIRVIRSPEKLAAVFKKLSSSDRAFVVEYEEDMATKYVPVGGTITVPLNEAINATAESAKEWAKKAITNNTDLPEGTTYAFTAAVDTSTSGSKQGTVRVSYPDGTQEDVAVTVVVKSEAESFIDAHGENGVLKFKQPPAFDYGHKVSDAEKRALVEGSETLPPTATVIVVPNNIDTNITTKVAEGESTHKIPVRVVVRFSDGSTAKVGTDPKRSGDVLVKTAADTFDPKPTIKVYNANLGEAIANTVAGTLIPLGTLPQGTVAEFSPAVDTDSTGNKTANIKITYPDASVDNEKITVDVTSEADKWKKTNSMEKPPVQEQTFDYGATISEDDKWNFIPNSATLFNKANETISVTPNINTKPGENGHRQQVTVRVTFRDGSYLENTTYANIRQASDTYKPQAAKITVDYGKNPTTEAIKTAITDEDGKTFPEGTKFELVTSTFNNKKTDAEQEVTYTVTYPDKSTEQVKGKIQVNKSLADKNTPTGGTIKAKLNEDVSARAGEAITNASSMPANTTYRFKNKVDTSVAVTKTETVVVTYSDGSEDEVQVTVVIGTDAERWTQEHGENGKLKFKTATFKYNEKVTDAQKKALIENSESLPAKATVSANINTLIKSETEPTKNHEVPVTVGVRFEDNSIAVVKGTVYVETATTTFDPTMLKQSIAKNTKDAVSDADAEATVDLAKLPPGTTATFKKPLPTTDASKNEKATIVVKYPDSSKDERQIDFIVKSKADRWLEEHKLAKISGNDQIFDYGHQITNNDKWGFVAEKDQFTNKEELSIAVNPDVNTTPTNVGVAQPVTVTITFDDNSTLSATANANIRSAADTLNPPQASKITVDYGKNPTEAEIKQAVTAGGGKSFPTGTAITLDKETFNNKLTGRDQEVTYTVTYPDGTTDKVKGVIRVRNSLADDNDPTGGSIQVEKDTALSPTAGADWAQRGITNAGKMPKGTTYAFKNTVDTSRYAIKTEPVIVTFSDGSTKEVNVEVKIGTDAQRWSQDNGSDGNITLQSILLDYDEKINEEAVKAKKESIIVNRSTIPSTATVTISNIDTHVTKEKGKDEANHKVPVTAKIEFADGSSLEKAGTVEVKTAADTFNPQSVITIPVDKNASITDSVASQAVNSTGLPASLPTGTTFTFKDPKPTSTETGTKTAPILVNYPDKSTDEISSTIVVTSLADKWKTQNPTGFKAKDMTYDYGQALTEDNKWDLVLEPAKFVKNDVTITVEPAVNTSPKAGGHTQPVKVTITFSDDSTLSDNATVTIRTAKESLGTPTAALITVDYGNNPTQQQINDAVKPPTGKTFPEGTSIALKEGTFDNTKTGNPQNVTYIVSYPDGTTQNVSGQIKVNDSEADKNDPVGGTITVPLNTVLDPDNGADKAKEAITNNKDLPTGTKYAFKSAVNTSKPSVQRATVVVTYPDKAKEDVTVTVKVGTDAQRWTEEHGADGKPIFKTAHFKYDEKVSETKKNGLLQNFDQLPEGASLTVSNIDTHVTTATKGEHHELDVTLTITFKDNSVAKVTGKVTVEKAATTFDPEAAKTKILAMLKQPIAATEAEAAVNMSKLPKGTSAEFKDGVPSTANTGISNTDIKVVYPDKSFDTMTIPVEVKSLADKNNFEAQDQTFDYGTNVTDDMKWGFVVDQNKVKKQGRTVTITPDVNTTPAGAPNGNNRHEQAVQVTVTYEDGSQITKSAKAFINLANASGYNPNAAPITVDYGQDPTQDEINKAVTPSKGKTFPSGTAIALTAGLNNTQPGEQTVTYTITYPDGTTENVQGKITVRESIYSETDPQGGTIVVSKNTPLGPSAGAEYAKSAIINNKELPQNATYKFKNDVDTSVPAIKKATVVVTFDDGLTKEAEVTVKIGTDAERWTHEHGENGKLKFVTNTFKYDEDLSKGDGLAKKENLLANREKLPKDAQLVIGNINTHVTEAAPADGEHTKEATIVVIFPDKSKAGVKGNVTIEKAATTFEPAMKQQEINLGKGDTVTDNLAKIAVDASKLPAGTNIAFERPLVDTSETGTKAASIVVTYPDSSVDRASLNIKITSKADTWLKKHDLTEITGHDQTFDYGHTLTDDEKWAFITEKAMFDNDRTAQKVTLALNPEVNTSPTVTTKPQSINVTVTFTDGSTLTTSAKATIKSAKDTYNPVAEKITVSYGNDPTEEQIKKAVTDKNKTLPNGTSIILKSSPKFDNTLTGKEQDVKYQVTYPDGTTEDVAGKIQVADSIADGQNPVGTTVTVPKGEVLDPTHGSQYAQAAIENNETLKGSPTFAFKQKVDTDVPGTYPAKVIVTYSDGSTDEVDVTVKVGTDAERWIQENGEDGKLKFNQKTFDYDEDVNSEDAKSKKEELLANRSKLPEDAKIAVSRVNTHVTEAVKEGETTHKVPATVVVIFADGSKAAVKGEALVKQAADTFDPTKLVETVSLGVGDTVADSLVNNIVKLAGLPVGTSLAFGDPQPTTDKPKSLVQDVIVTYPDSSTDKVQVTINVTSEADSWKKRNGKTELETNNQTFNYGHVLTEEDKWNFVADKDTFDREKVTLEITPAVNTTPAAGGHTQTVNVKITFNKDNSTLEKTAVATIRPANQSYTPSATEISVGYGKVPTAEQLTGAVTPGEGTSFPPGTTIEIKGGFTNESKVPGNHTVTYKITYPDGTVGEVTGTITVTKGINDLYDPQGGSVQVEKGTKLGPTSGAEYAKKAITNNADLPADAKYSFKDEIDTSVPAVKQAKVIVTYSDGSTDEVDVTVKVGTDAERWIQENGEDGKLKFNQKTFDYDEDVNSEDAKSKKEELLANRSKLPEDAKIAVSRVNTHVTEAVKEGETTHKVPATVVVIFADGSKAAVKGNVTIEKAATTFEPTMKHELINLGKGDKITDNLARLVVDAGKLPAGTDIVFERPLADTDETGAKTATILVTYPDSSVDKKTLNIKVTSMADRWTSENGKNSFTGKNQTFDYGQVLTGEDKWNFVTEKDTFDDTQVTITLNPEVNTSPNAGGHTQNIGITLTFADGSTLTGNAVATIRTAKDTYNPVAGDLEVLYGNDPTPQEIMNAVVPSGNMTYPPGTTITLNPGFDNTNTDGPQDVTYTVTYPDGSSETVDGKITVTDNRSDKLKYEPVPKNIPVVYGKPVPPVTEGITNLYDANDPTNKNNLPEGTRFSPEKGNIDTTVVGNHVVDVEVIYPDGTSEKVRITYVVGNANDAFDPQAKKPNIKVALNSNPGPVEAKSAIVTDGLPEGTKYAFETPVDTSTTGTKTGVIVLVTYPDGSVDKVPVDIEVTSEAKTWVERNGELIGTIATYDYGSKLGPNDLLKLIEKSELIPADATISVDPAINTTPEKGGHKQPVKVKVTFADKSSLTADATAIIKTVLETVGLTEKIPGLVVHTGDSVTNADAPKTLITDNHPDGTKYRFKDPIDTSKPGEVEVTVIVEFPDGSVGEKKVKITITNDAYEWEKKHGGLQTVPRNFPWGSKIGEGELRSLIVDGDKLPKGAKIIVEPEINTTPDQDKDRIQNVKVTVIFEDGSKLSGKVRVEIDKKPASEKPAVKPNKPAKPSRGKAPKTGDNAMIPYAALLLGSILPLAVIKRKRWNKDEM